VVRELKQLFEQHWLAQGGSADELAPDAQALSARGDEVVRVIGSQGGQLTPRYYATLISAIRSAATHIWVTAAYFVPTLQEKHALARAARRGVDDPALHPRPGLRYDRVDRRRAGGRFHPGRVRPVPRDRQAL